MKRIFVLICFVAMALLLCIARYCSDRFWEAVCINAGTSFMALGVGLVFVNIYLERNARRGAVKSLLVLSNRAMTGFHDSFINLCWAKYGRDEWGRFGQEYLNSGGKPEALRQDVRDFLYQIAKTNREIESKRDKLLETLTELSRLVGWDLDAGLLKACLDARIAFGRLKDVIYDDSQTAKNDASEHLMDADIQTGIARQLLISIAGISEERR